MEDFSGIIKWENLFKQSENFMKNKPFKFTFVEDFFEKNFYEKLFETYPKIDQTWLAYSDLSKYQLGKFWRNHTVDEPTENIDDPNFSEAWNKFKRYSHTKEFVENFRKFSGVTVNKLKFFSFTAYTQGGFQLPHYHNSGPSTLILMIYFSKNWEKGDPGGTYVASELDESSIIFEPYNLDNSLFVCHDGSKAIHGVRYITKNAERQALQIQLEGYSEKLGWSGRTDKAKATVSSKYRHS